MGMFDFMENPHMGQYMGQMGMGLLAASQPQPYGVNRYSLIQNSMNQANQNLMRQQMFDMQKEEYEEKKKDRMKAAAEADNLKTAQSALFGGPDPSTDITWRTGRQGMSPEETMAAVGQVAPEAAIERMLAKPKMTDIMTNAAEAYGKGTPEYFRAIKEGMPTNRNLSTLGKLILGRKKALAAGDMDAVAQFDARIKKENTISSGTTVNVDARGNSLPKPKEGFVYLYNPEGTVKTDENGLPVQAPIPGGPADIAEQEKFDKKEGRDESRRMYGGVVVTDVDRAFKIMDDAPVPSTGMWSYIGGIPGTPQHSVKQLVAGMKANVGFDRIQTMRENSPTGGALGNVSNFEVDTLQKTLGSLEQTMRKEDFEYNLMRVKVMYAEIINGHSNIPRGPNGEIVDKAAWGRFIEEETARLMAERTGKPTRLKYNPQTGEFE